MRSEHPRNFFFLGARKKKFWAEPPADPRGTNIPERIFWEPERKNFGQSLRRTHEERTSQKEFSGSPNEKWKFGIRCTFSHPFYAKDAGCPTPEGLGGVHNLPMVCLFHLLKIVVFAPSLISGILNKVHI